MALLLIPWCNLKSVQACGILMKAKRDLRDFSFKQGLWVWGKHGLSIDLPNVAWCINPILQVLFGNPLPFKPTSKRTGSLRVLVIFLKQQVWQDPVLARGMRAHPHRLGSWAAGHIRLFWWFCLGRQMLFHEKSVDVTLFCVFVHGHWACRLQTFPDEQLARSNAENMQMLWKLFQVSWACRTSNALCRGNHNTMTRHKLGRPRSFSVIIQPFLISLLQFCLKYFKNHFEAQVAGGFFQKAGPSLGHWSLASWLDGIGSSVQRVGRSWMGEIRC